MENTEKIKMFLKIVEQIGDFEDLYIPALYYNDENINNPYIINVIKDKRYYLNAREVRLFNKLEFIKVEELNREVNVLRQERLEVEKLIDKQRFNNRKNIQEEYFDKEYNEFYGENKNE